MRSQVEIDAPPEVVGSTFYTLEVFPTWYWTPIADAAIHRIQLRVLRHIQALSEAGSG